MPKFYVSTFRDGKQVLGNMDSVHTIWTDLKTTKGAINRAIAWGKRLAKPGDEIRIAISYADNQPLADYRLVASFTWQDGGITKQRLLFPISCQ